MDWMRHVHMYVSIQSQVLFPEKYVVYRTRRSKKTTEPFDLQDMGHKSVPSLSVNRWKHGKTTPIIGDQYFLPGAFSFGLNVFNLGFYCLQKKWYFPWNASNKRTPLAPDVFQRGVTLLSKTCKIFTYLPRPASARKEMELLRIYDYDNDVLSFFHHCNNSISSNRSSLQIRFITLYYGPLVAIYGH